MATSITELANELRDYVRFQRTPIPMTQDDYIRMVKHGVRRLYVDTQQASDFRPDMFFEEKVSDDSDETIVYFEKDLPLDEQEYVLCCAQIAFLKEVAHDVNNIVGYTTDALTVTNADKPYANLKDSIEKAENDRRITYYKMVRYNMLTE